MFNGRILSANAARYCPAAIQSVLYLDKFVQGYPAAFSSSEKQHDSVRLQYSSHCSHREKSMG